MTAHDTEAQSGTRRLVVDRSACAGHGLCYGRAPEIIDCDDAGYPVLVQETIRTEEHIVAAEVAVAMCPERALSLETL